ncbi:MAG: MbnH family di-heme enzyme [Acidobacteriota bacterium]
MMARRVLFLIFVVAIALSAADWDWHLRPGIPRPIVPEDNPMTVAKVELGRYLFYDKRMSVNGKGGCASCHIQALAFAEGHARPTSVVGDIDPRGSMSLVNVAYAPSLTWAHSGLTSLEEQALKHMLSVDPVVEMGLLDHEQEFLDILRTDATYQRLFPQVFPGADQITLKNVAKALAAFERSIVSMRSPYDRYRWDGDASAISDSAKRGEAIFSSSERGGCVQCHGGWNFSAVRSEGDPSGPQPRGEFFNTGVAQYEAPNRGAYEDTGRYDDFGKFRAPTLRNIALTDPYMHDGSFDSLEEVIDHYAAGGKFDQVNKTRVLRPFRITDSEKGDLIEFLESLTDDELIRDPRWSDPWSTNGGPASDRPAPVGK